jgi:hypothetical protein
MIFRHLLFISESKCNASDLSSQCTDMHAVGLSLKALSLGIIFIISIAMNVTICLVFYKKSQLLTVSNTFVLNLIGCQLGEYFFFFFFFFFGNVILIVTNLLVSSHYSFCSLSRRPILVTPQTYWCHPIIRSVRYPVVPF